MKAKLTRKMTVRFSEDEYKRIVHGFRQTTQRKLSEYVRKVLLHLPVTVYTRSQSFDDFVAEIILLKAELKAIGNNFNQLVKKLHSCDTDQEIKYWAALNENSKLLFFKKVSEIQDKINQISNKWSQE